MLTVLGLSKTSTSLGWVLVDARAAAGEPLDHDFFCLDTDEPASASVTDLARTARRVREIATASGHSVVRVRMACSDLLDGGEASFRKALIEQGFDDVAVIPLGQAIQAWAKVVARAMGHDKTAVCILEHGEVSLSVVDTRNGAVQTDTTSTRDSAGLTDWLGTVFNRDSRPPESLLLIGSRRDVDEIACLLDDALPVPVDGSIDAQLALARGAALSSTRCAKQPAARHKSRFTGYARTGTVTAAIAVITTFALTSAAGPNRGFGAESQQSVFPPPPEAAEKPNEAQPGPPLVLTTPPPVEAKAVPEAAAPKTTAPRIAVPESTVASVPQAVTISAPETASAAPPVPHLPDVQPVQHLPEAQPGVSPAVAPGPPSSDPVPPPPQDPVEQVLSPLFSGLP